MTLRNILIIYEGIEPKHYRARRIFRSSFFCFFSSTCRRKYDVTATETIFFFFEPDTNLFFGSWLENPRLYDAFPKHPENSQRSEQK
jgi:hypothetical protein